MTGHAVFFLIAAATAVAADKPRIFITESQALQAAGEAVVGETKGALYLTGGTSSENIEVMKSFRQHCPDVAITSNRDKADYVVRLDRETPSPVTLFVKGNKVAIFDRNDDFIYGDSARLLKPVVKGACSAILGHSRRQQADQ